LCEALGVGVGQVKLAVGPTDGEVLEPSVVGLAGTEAGPDEAPVGDPLVDGTQYGVELGELDGRTSSALSRTCPGSGAWTARRAS
jgi:hypothetical protein